MLPADIWPPQSRYRSSRFTRSLLRAAVRMKLMPLYKDPEHRHVFDSEVAQVRQWGPMTLVACKCGENKLFSAIAE